MHKSRFSSIIIDCEGTDPEVAARFWGAAFGRDLKPPQDGEPNYRDLDMRADEPLVLVQKVGHASRVHLDIESDDLEAEVRRLEALGAKRVEFVRRWWVMEAPTGQRFCVINPQRGPLGDNANVWHEDGSLQKK